MVGLPTMPRTYVGNGQKPEAASRCVVLVGTAPWREIGEEMTPGEGAYRRVLGRLEIVL